uniref:Uncharacterized protein n=1 Tax=Mycena chlorophos TaxID=658473 RepID=A0ABQ0KV96_MYCCL|nr:predicted protein [Mycena chlorophos]
MYASFVVFINRQLIDLRIYKNIVCIGVLWWFQIYNSWSFSFPDVALDPHRPQCTSSPSSVYPSQRPSKDPSGRGSKHIFVLEGVSQPRAFCPDLTRVAVVRAAVENERQGCLSTQQITLVESSFTSQSPMTSQISKPACNETMLLDESAASRAARVISTTRRWMRSASPFRFAAPTGSIRPSHAHPPQSSLRSIHVSLLNLPFHLLLYPPATFSLCCPPLCPPRSDFLPSFAFHGLFLPFFDAYDTDGATDGHWVA